MSTFNERERAFEAKFTQDAEMHFRARTRRNRFMAVWASALKGESVDDARAFAKKLIHHNVHHASDDEVVNAVLKYLGDKTNETEVRAKLQEMLAEAKEQMLSEHG